MCSRVIIEQKIADLELALNRQEELIRSQKDVLRSLKDLITNEYNNQWQQPNQQPQSYLLQGIALSNNMGGSNVFMSSMSSSNNNNTGDDQPLNASTSTVTKKLLTKQAVDEITEPTKKRSKPNGEEQRNIPPLPPSVSDESLYIIADCYIVIK